MNVDYEGRLNDVERERNRLNQEKNASDFQYSIYVENFAMNIFFNYF